MYTCVHVRTFHVHGPLPPSSSPMCGAPHVHPPTHSHANTYTIGKYVFRALSLDDPVLKLLYGMPVILSVTGHRCSHSHCAIKESMFVLTVMVGGPSLNSRSRPFYFTHKQRKHCTCCYVNDVFHTNPRR